MWTNIPKPGAQTYTDVNPISKTQYDDALVTYDSITVFYDGGNPNMWTDVNKPGVQGWVNVPKPT